MKNLEIIAAKDGYETLYLDTINHRYVWRAVADDICSAPEFDCPLNAVEFAISNGYEISVTKQR